MVGVQNGRTRDAVETTIKDSIGRTFVLSSASQLKHPEPLVLHDSTDGTTRSLYAVASTQQQADEFVRDLRAEGKPVSVKREMVPLLFADIPMAEWGFGGTDTFRGVAKSVVNLLAQRYPERAREPWLAAVKQFIRYGGPFEGLVDYEYSAGATELTDSFDFQHRFILTFDAASGRVYAKVSLLGVVDLRIHLGSAAIVQSETMVYEMDVLARRPPDDIRIQTFAGVTLCPPEAPTTDPRPFIFDRLRLLDRKRADLIWRREGAQLVQSHNDARNSAQADQHDLVVQALGDQRQRLLNLAGSFARKLQRHLTQTIGAEGQAIGGAFRLFTQGDRSSKTGVTDLTYAVAEMLRFVMADHILRMLTTRPIESVELQGLLEGSAGELIVGEYMLAEMKKGHPWFSSITD
ncbi:MAG: hypothetical protein ABI548_25670 [Polyangiaceae bacterium]